MTSNDLIQRTIRLRADQWAALDADADLAMSDPASWVRDWLAVTSSAFAANLARFHLTVNEACCLADITAGSMVPVGISIGDVKMLAAELHDAEQPDRLGIGNTYGAKWSVDTDDLYRRINDTDPATELALRMALARWWAAGDDGDAQGFAAAGINVSDKASR